MSLRIDWRELFGRWTLFATARTELDPVANGQPHATADPKVSTGAVAVIDYTTKSAIWLKIVNAARM